MATFLHVTQGPDAGRKFSIERETVRIGNDSNANIRINDPQLQGLLVIRWQNGVYHVSNQLSSPIWYRNNEQREEFAQGEERVWYDGVRLQPTARTELLLRAELSAGAISSGIQETTERAAESDGVVKTLAILGIALGMLVLMASVDSPTQLPAEHQTQLAEDIRKLLEAAPKTRSARFNEDWSRLAVAFREARFADRAGDEKDAADLYLKCSQIQSVLRKHVQNDGTIELSEGHEDALQKMTTLVNQRKLKLSR